MGAFKAKILSLFVCATLISTQTLALGGLIANSIKRVTIISHVQMHHSAGNHTHIHSHSHPHSHASHVLMNNSDPKVMSRDTKAYSYYTHSSDDKCSQDSNTTPCLNSNHSEQNHSHHIPPISDSSPQAVDGNGPIYSKAFIPISWDKCDVDVFVALGLKLGIIYRPPILS
jgi:hypothetical protein